MSPFQLRATTDRRRVMGIWYTLAVTFLALVDGDAGGWHVDRDALTDAIRVRWAEVAIESSHRSEVRSPIWEFDTDNGPGEAYLHEDGTCLYMDASEEDATGWRSHSAG